MEIQREEEMISRLEEIDNTFSLINKNLKEIKNKIEKVKTYNKKILRDCEPWINFFSTTVKNNSIHEADDTNTVTKEIQNSFSFVHSSSPNLMKWSSPNNPFVSSHSIENKSWLKSFERRYNTKLSESEESSKVILPSITKEEVVEFSITEEPKFPEVFDDSEVYELIPFSKSLLPEIFYNEDVLIDIYELISKKKCVAVQEVHERFRDVSREKVDIFIELLIRKKFIRYSQGSLSV